MVAAGAVGLVCGGKRKKNGSAGEWIKEEKTELKMERLEVQDAPESGRVKARTNKTSGFPQMPHFIGDGGPSIGFFP